MSKFDTSKGVTVVEMLIKEDGSYERWDLASRQSKAMILVAAGHPIEGYGVISNNGINYMLDVDLDKCSSEAIWP